jgi:hypothetical protein
MVTLVASLAALTASIGQAVAQPFWPYSGLTLLLLMVLSAGALLTLAVRPRHAMERSRAEGLLFFLGGVTTGALALGYGRGGLGLPYENDYAILSIQGLCAMYVVWSLYRPWSVGMFMQMCLFTLMVLVIPMSFTAGLEDARNHRSVMVAFEEDLRKGTQPHLLVVRHGKGLHEQDGWQGTLLERMCMLHQAGIGPFRDLGEDPAFREVSVPATSALPAGMEWREGAWHGQGPGSSLTFTLPQPRFVAGIRIPWAGHSNGMTAHVRVSWRRSGMPDFPPEPQYFCPAGFLEAPATIYIADQIDQIRIEPDDKPFAVSMPKIVLLLEPYLEVPFRAEPVVVNEMTWTDGAGRGVGNDPFLVFALEKRRFISAIRLKYRYENTVSPATFQAFWKDSGRNDFVDEERNVVMALATDQEPGIVIVWVNDSIDHFRIDPDIKPCGFQLYEITLLVPDSGAQPSTRLAEPYGGFDVADGTDLLGWAWDPRQPDRSISVDIFDGEVFLGSVAADREREDLREAEIGPHAFAYPVPKRLRDGHEHTIHIRTSGTNVELEGSPKTVRFAP